MKFTLFGFLALAAFGQEMSGPSLGWLPSDDGRSLRALYGVPGAARMGLARAWPVTVTDVVVSPSGDRAVALEAGVAVLVNMVTLQRTPLAADLSAEVKIWSPLGTALLLAKDGAVRTYALRAGRFDLVGERNLAASRYAVSDDGTAILAAVGEELLLHSAAGVSIAGRGSGSFTFLARTNQPIFSEGNDLVIGGERYSLGMESPWLESPMAGRILAIERSRGKLVWLDGQGARIAEASCQCEVSRVERIGTAGTLRLVSDGAGPAWLAETSLGSQRLFFIPQPEEKPEVEQ